MVDKVLPLSQQFIPETKKAPTSEVDLTPIRDRQAAYQTDLRGQRGNTNITLPANAQYWSKEKIQPSSDPTKRTSSLQNEFGGRNGNQPTNHIFSFQDPKAGQQYRHIQTDSANPSNVTVNGRPLSEMTPKFTDPESRNQGSAPLRFSTPGMGLQNGPSAIDSQLRQNLSNGNSGFGLQGLPNSLNGWGESKPGGGSSNDGGGSNGGSSSSGNPTNNWAIPVERTPVENTPKSSNESIEA